MKIGENNSIHQLSKMLHASLKFDFFWGGGDDLHLQIIESIFPKVSEENSSAQWVIFVYLSKSSEAPHIFKRKLIYDYSILNQFNRVQFGVGALVLCI